MDSLNTLQHNLKNDDYENLKMCLKGHLLKSLEHQWKQPLNYISTNLLNLEINAELNKLNLDAVNTFNKNVEQAIQTLSNHISFYNKLFNTSKGKSSFTLNTIFDNYMHIVEHKIRNNDIKLEYNNITQSPRTLHNYENELALKIILLLYIFSDFLIKSELKNITIELKQQNKEKYCELIFHINTDMEEKILIDNYNLHWSVIKSLLERCSTKISYETMNNNTLITLQMVS